jgi:hypothetical protein
MHPRTIAILVGAILLVSLGLRVALHEGDLLFQSEEGVLKQATSLSVVYRTAAGQKTLTITKPEELADLFSVLDLRRPRPRDEEDVAVPFGARGPVGGTVTFHFPDGTRQPLQFVSEHRLGDTEVNPRFYEKLCGYVSRAEGRQLNRLDEEPGMQPQLENGPGEAPGQPEPNIRRHERRPRAGH